MIKHLKQLALGTLAAILAFSASHTAAADPLVAAISFDIPISNASITAQDQEIIGIESGGTGVLLVAMLTDMLPPEADIDAFDFIAPNRVYFSIDAPASIGGVIYQDEDVLLWDGAALSLAWSGSANGLPAEADVDAISIVDESPLEFSFSLDSPASLVFTGGTFIVSGATVIHFTTGVGFTGLDFDPAVAGLPSEANVDTINRPGDGTFILSFDSPMVLAGGTVDDGDAITWDPQTASFGAIVFSAASAGLPGEADLDGLEIKSADLNGYDGRPFGDFDSNGCTDINDFLFLLDYWTLISPIGGEAIGINDFLALLDYWNIGVNCP